MYMLSGDTPKAVSYTHLFQLHLPAFGAQLRDGDTGRVVNDQLGITNNADALHHRVPVRIRQGACTQLLGVHIGPVSYTHLSGARFLPAAEGLSQVRC